MTHSLFISDLHLRAAQPQSLAAFRRFTSGIARQAEALYILGDLFEYWAGDDDLEDPCHREVADLLHALAQHGTAIFIMQGNRDLLMGDTLLRACGARTLDVLRQHGYPRLIHGHTHRPQRHEHLIDGHRCERWVLNDWDVTPGALRCEATGCTPLAI